MPSAGRQHRHLPEHNPGCAASAACASAATTRPKPLIHGDRRSSQRPTRIVVPETRPPSVYRHRYRLGVVQGRGVDKLVGSAVLRRALRIASSKEHRLHPLYVTTVGTGLRQGGLLGLKWSNVDLPNARLTVRHTLQRIDGEFVLVEPKTERSRRTIALPDVVVRALRGHRTKQKMERLVAGSRWVATGHVFATSRGTRWMQPP